MPGATNEVTFEGFILAGGVSSRMRRAKHLLDFGGLPLIVLTSGVVAPLVQRVTVIGANAYTVPAGIVVIPDDHFASRSEINRSNGPLDGIATALAHSRSTWNLILACDMPYLSAEWLGWLLNRAVNSTAEAVVPRTKRGLEPLAAVYRRDCQRKIVEELSRGVRKATDALKQVDLEILNETEWREMDPDGLVLKNMNTPADYEAAQTWFREKGFMRRTNEIQSVRQPLRGLRRPTRR